MGRGRGNEDGLDRQIERGKEGRALGKSQGTSGAPGGANFSLQACALPPPAGHNYGVTQVFKGALDRRDIVYAGNILQAKNTKPPPGIRLALNPVKWRDRKTREEEKDVERQLSGTRDERRGPAGRCLSLAHIQTRGFGLRGRSFRTLRRVQFETAQ